MIEDPNLTLRILKYFADPLVGNPANKLPEDLMKELPGVELDRLEYHIRCARENGLLTARISRVAANMGVAYCFGFIDGLTAKGGDYVRNAQTRYWEMAFEKIENAGANVTTTLLVKFLPKVIEGSLGL